MSVGTASVVVLPKTVVLASQIIDKSGKCYLHDLAFKDPKVVIADCTEAIRLDPKSASAYRIRGAARSNLEDYQGAIADFNRALWLAPKYEGAYLNRGMARSNMGDYQGAIVDFNEVLRLYPTDSGAYYHRGIARSNLGEHQGAIADFNESIRLTDPKYSYYAYANRAEVFVVQKNFQSALKDANQAIQLNSKYFFGFVARGAAHIGLNDYEGAQKDFDQAMRIAPKKDGSVYYWRGLLRLKQNQYQQSISDYEQAVQLTPTLKKSKTYEDYSLTARSQLNQPIATQSPKSTPSISQKPTQTAKIDPPKSATSSSTPSPTISPPNVYKIAKQVTVSIDGQNAGSGSGVIISKVDGTYYVLTAKHVVENQSSYTVLTPGGKKHPLDSSQIKKLSDLDLAVVQFKSGEDYPVAQMGDSEKVSEGDTIIVSGWPGVDQAITKLSAPITPKGEIASIQQGNGDGYEFIYSNATSQGMSGGPIFDSTGRVVGIHGRASGNEERGKNGLNLGIPIHLFLRQAPQAGLNLQQIGLKAENNAFKW
jgi:tetratricopeptide (TPR) repeat protein